MTDQPSRFPPPVRALPLAPQFGRGDAALVADRLHRAAFVADLAGGDRLAGPLLDAARLVRGFAEGTLSPAGTEYAAEMVAALLGHRDNYPLP